MEIKKLVQKIGDLSEITFNQKNFFLYDESNYMNHTFYTELNTELQIYGLISTSAIGIKTTNLIRPENSLKFRVLYYKYMDHIVLRLEDIRKSEKIETKDAKVSNFSILSTKPKRKLSRYRTQCDEYRFFVDILISWFIGGARYKVEPINL